MSTGVCEAQTATRASGGSGTVFISEWFNESPPPWDEILTAHDVARLTRRHRWVLSALTFLGHFPKKQRFHGRNVGWRRHDVERWLERSRKPGVRGGRLFRPACVSSAAITIPHGLLCRCSRRCR